MALPEVEISSSKLRWMLLGSTLTRLLTTGIRLGVFDHLTEPSDADRIARTVGCDTLNAERFLNMLTASGLLEKKNGLYKNLPIAEIFLVKESPSYLGKLFLMQAGKRDLMTKDLYKLVKEGPPSDSKDMFSNTEEYWGRCSESAAIVARSGIAQKMSGIVSRLPEFPSFRNMMDLGGGPGIFGIAMVLAHPSMTGVVFDLKPAAESAKKYIAEYGVEDRMDVRAGDYNQDPLGGPYDFIWASSTLNFARPGMDPVLKKIYNALNPGGVFVNFSEGLTHEKTQPDFMVLSTTPGAMNNRPWRPFDQGVIAEAMLKAGFKSVRSQTVEDGWSATDLISPENKSFPGPGQTMNWGLVPMNYPAANCGVLGNQNISD